MEEKKIKNWFNEQKSKAKFRLNQAGCWIHNNKEVIIACTPMAIAGFGFAGKVVKNRTTKMKVKHAEKQKLMSIYDPHNGWYCELKRPLTIDEKICISERPDGMSITSILMGMNVLKR